MTSSSGSCGGTGRELDHDALGFVALVAVLDGVDDGFADRHADPVQLIVVEAGHATDVVADHLDEIQHVERAGELESDGVRVRHQALWRAPVGAFDAIVAR